MNGGRRDDTVFTGVALFDDDLFIWIGDIFLSQERQGKENTSGLYKILDLCSGHCLLCGRVGLRASVTRHPVKAVIGNMKIRSAVSEDYLALGYVYCHAWKDGYKGIVPESFLNALTDESSAPSPDRIQSDNTFVAEENGRIIGLTGFGKSRDHTENIGELWTIYVLSEFWGKEVGAQLFLAAHSALKQRGYTGFYLWVLKDNHRARKFYEKMGMQLTNEERVIAIGGKHSLKPSIS